MPSDFVAFDRSTKTFDLDTVTMIARGFSGKRHGWTGTIVYEPGHDTMIELRSSPPDVRGGSDDEAEEVSPDYIAEQYGLSKGDIAKAQEDPASWKVVDLRSGG
jgi:hypothetical protein